MLDIYVSLVEKKTFYSIFKRSADILISLILLVVTCPIVMLAIILVKLDSEGSGLYKQIRVGLLGEEITIRKIRTMKNDAEVKGAVWAEKDDPRITKVGKFLRVTRIDELPQLLNVLNGSMSLIGPRPERPEFTMEFEKELPGFVNRLSVKPGLSGWAQVNGGYDISFEEKLEYDMYYIQNFGLLIDMKIFFKTIKVVISGDGAR